MRGGTTARDDPRMWPTDDTHQPPMRCTVCGAELTGDKDDDASHPTGPMCGDCYRARAFDDQLWAMGAAADDEDAEDDDLW